MHKRDLEIVTQLIAKSEVNLKIDNTPFKTACSNGHLEIVKVLIANGLCPKTYATEGMKYGALYGKENIVKWMLKLCANVEDNGYAGLRWALAHRHTKCMQLLIDAGSDAKDVLTYYKGLAASSCLDTEGFTKGMTYLNNVVRKQKIEALS